MNKNEGFLRNILNCKSPRSKDKILNFPQFYQLIHTVYFTDLGKQNFPLADRLKARGNFCYCTSCIKIGETFFIFCRIFHRFKEAKLAYGGQN